jgi:hypothetical protein
LAPSIPGSETAQPALRLRLKTVRCLYRFCMESGFFTPALTIMESTASATYGPEPLKDYMADHFPGASFDTANLISVDDRKRLRSELIGAGAMVLRMGQQAKGVTDFALVRPENGISSYFIDDSDLGVTAETTFLSRAAQRDLYVFELLHPYVESSMINLAFASGLLSQALELDSVGGLPPPARGASTYTFDVRPHSTIDVLWQHRAGQVEIDALFIGERNKRDVLFIIEAKTASGPRSLAKHKLVYPALALAPLVPADVDIVPVYLKMATSVKGVLASVVECSMPDPRLGTPAIDELKPVRVARLRLPINVG